MPEDPITSLPKDAKILGTESSSAPIKSLPSDIKVLGVEKGKPNYVPHIDDFAPEPGDNNDKIESAINFLSENYTTKGGMIDLDKDVLRDVMKNPNATKEQIKEAIGTIQSGNLYYVKNEGGVMVPKQLKEGERPPKGYNVQSVWGTQKESNDDPWYLDLGKSLYNGVLGAAGGAVDLAQSGTMLATGEESNYLNKLSNTAEALKFQKDESLNKPIYNTEGVNAWGDLVDKDRFDISPSALWGTLNMAAESITSFYGGANAATKLGKLGPKASAYTGSYLTQLGDNLDNARETGLEGREAAAFASLTTSIQAAIDAQYGLESKIYRGSFKKSADDLIKDLGSKVAKDATGKITEEGFKQLAKETTLRYGKLASVGAKEIGKDALKEGAQETGQDFVAKAAENLWDKMDINERRKFGTDVTSPESFASYIQNGLSGLVAGTPMAIASTNVKKKYDEQSINAFSTVQKGPEAVAELKSNLAVAKEKGTISPTEYEQAIFKVDAYDKYNEQTKDLDLDNKQKKEAFELSFNIEAIKSEINSVSKEDLESLDPIGHAKINNKKTLINGLQKELDNILIKQDIQTETKVGQDTVNKVAKDNEPEDKETEPKPKLNDLIKRFGKPKPTPTEKIVIDDTEETPSITEKKAYKQFAYDRDNTPDFEVKDDKGTYEFNKLTDPISKQRSLRNYLDKNPQLNNEIQGNIVQGQNNVWQIDLGDGRYVQFAKSIKPEEFVGETDNFPEEFETYKDSDGRELKRYKEPVVVKLEEITGTREDRKGQRLRVFNVYNAKTGKYIWSVKERQKGGSNYDKGEIDQLIKLQNNQLPFTKTKVKTKPKEEAQNASLEEAALRDEYERTELTDEEAASELEKEAAREQVFAETGMFTEKGGKKGKYDNTELYNELDSLKGKSAKDVLGAVLNRAKDKNVKEFISTMINNSAKIDSFVKFKGFVDTKMGGVFDPATGDIVFNNDLITSRDEQEFIRIVAHEYMHAFTTKALSKRSTAQEKQFYNDIKSVYDTLKKDTAYTKEYGFTNLYEFVSELSSNPDFVNKLKNNNKSIFQKIVDAIKKLFGIKGGRAELVDKGIKSVLDFIPQSAPGKVGSVAPLAAKKSSDEENKVKKLVDSISKESDLNKYTTDQLLEVYSAIFNTELSETKKKGYLSDVMKRIALNMKQRGIDAIGGEVSEDNLEKDISFIDKWFKVLSHFSDSFPEMKEFSKIWNSAYFNKMKEAKAEKRTHDKLALDVIKARNKQLGIVDNAKRLAGQIISENRHKYFDFLDNGKGKLITLEEANKKSLSYEQKAYLKYTREKLAARQKLDVDIYNADMDVLRLDKSFGEAFKTEGIISAVGSWLGTNNLSNIKLSFTNPETGKTAVMDFIDIQNALSKYAEKGLKEKGIALASLIKYTLKAAKKRVKKGGEYLLDENGNLQSRFNKPVDERKSYSKDFYGALNKYIDDTAHIKHISPLVPIINSIEYLNSRDILDGEGNVLSEQKKNLTEWIDKWRKLHVLGQSEETQSELDKALRLLRFMTSALTMWFNVPANILNVAIGNYNTWRQENSEVWAKGQKRLFGGTDRKVSKEYGFGVLNRYAADIVRKYSGVANDVDSNPIMTGKNILSQLGFLGQAWGEFQIQGSGLLGLMTDDDYNSFEYKTNKYGVEELVVKPGVDEKALEERILSNIDKVSDVQGKYSEKDRRNIQNNELGKVALQFKQWMPDAFRIRYGKEGSWRNMIRGGFAELRNDIQEKGKVKAFWENKDFMRNLKGLMATGLLMSLVYQDDEDKDKSYTAKLFQKALSDVLFVFEPDNLKFTISKPVAATKTIEKLIDIGDHMFAIEASDYYKSDSKYGNKGDSKLRGDLMGFVPGKKIIEQVIE